MVSTLLKIVTFYLTTYETSCLLSLNLLERLIMLYVRLRVFSLVNEKRELHKMEAKEKKLKSFRTEIKK